MLNIFDYIKSSPNRNFFLMAGPCAIESEELAFDIAGHIKEICEKLDIPFIFKGSYRKANRSRLDSFTGIGDERALNILKKVKENFSVPVVTDIHDASEAEMAAKYVDVLQIPAFLCRQTDLLIAAAKTGLPVNIKKGQFLSPASMQFAVEKVRGSIPSGQKAQVMVTDRGTMFGYGDLIVDMRGIPEMRKSCDCPVIVDVTHSLQQPNTREGVTGGLPEMIETIARSSIAAGCDGIFIETHPKPETAKSDGANMLRLDKLNNLLEKLTALRMVVNTIDGNDK